MKFEICSKAGGGSRGARALGSVGQHAMASDAPVTPMLGERRARSTRSAAAAVDKENCPPVVVATPIGKGVAAAEGKTPCASFATPAGKTGEAPKTLEQWNAILRSLPIATPSDRARLERLFERVLGSGSGNEELDVQSHKDNDVYVALWLYRIALDPEEGTTYTKFMRKWGIGRKYAAVYVQQVPRPSSCPISPPCTLHAASLQTAMPSAARGARVPGSHMRVLCGAGSDGLGRQGTKGAAGRH